MVWKMNTSCLILIGMLFLSKYSTFVECHGDEPHGQGRSTTEEGCLYGAQSCFSNLPNCDPTVTPGCISLSWNYTISTNIFDFVLTGSAQYAAFAFASVSAMENADMYYCTTSRFGSAAITGMNLPVDIQPIDPANIPTSSQEVVDGVVTCKFQRVGSVDKTVSGGLVKTFDLLSTNFYIIWAFGDANGNGFVTYHQSNRGSSSESVNFTSGAAIAPATDNTIDMVKAHACLMVLAWICFAGVGVIVARHFKPLWHDSTINSQKVWFQIHRLLMVSAVVFTIIGIILVFVARGGYSESAGSHAVTGLVTLGLAILNPILALFRPHPDAPRRKYFNYSHWFVGSAARIMGIVTVFLGVDLVMLDLPEWDTWVLVGYVVFDIIVGILLEVLSYQHGHIASYRKSQYKDEGAAPTGAGWKYLLLFLYSAAVTGFGIAFLYAIIVFGNN